MKILIGDISSYKAIVIAKYLKTFYPKAYVIAYDYKRGVKYFHTRYCDEFLAVPNPKKNQEGHIEFLRNIIQKKGISTFLPVHSEMYGKYIEHKDLFGEAFNYVGTFSSFDALHDKLKFNDLLNSLNLKKPIHFHSIDAAKLPCVVKPTNLSSAKGVRYIWTEQGRGNYRNYSQQDIIIQEYVEGVGCGYSVYSRDGQVLVGFGHIRLAEHPITGGSSVYRGTYFVSEMKEIAEKILAATKWTGFAMFEFKLGRNGEIYTIEVNPRIWGSINQGLQNGCNYFEPLFGKSELIVNRAIQHKTYLSPLLYFAFLGYLAKLNVRPVLSFLKNMKVNKADVSFLDDPKGFISLIARKI